MANDAQIEYWNDTAGPAWVARQAYFDAMLAPFGAVAVRAADVAAGTVVVDVGCGCGTTTLELARRVGPSGRVVGVDVSGPMLAVARQRAADEGLDAVAEFVRADAQTHPFALGAGADCVYSRMGVMFFDDPVAAFTNLGAATRSEGRLVFTCWQPLADNEWMAVPVEALRSVVTLPPPDPHAPGPFAFADPDRVRAVLSAAGWIDVTLEPVQERLALGGDEGLTGAMGHVAELSVTRAALADADEMTRTRAMAAMRAALAAHVDDRGHVRLDAAVWLVRARRPAATG